MQSLIFYLREYFLSHICGDCCPNKESKWDAVLKPRSYAVQRRISGLPMFVCAGRINATF